MRFIKSNAIAFTALIFAMTGTGIAASRYIITSTSQIKPSVLRELRKEVRVGHASAVTLAASGVHAVRARVRIVGPAATATEPESANVPLTDATWTQHAEEDNQLFGGTITMTVPGKAKCTVEAPSIYAQAGVQVLLDGTTVGTSGRFYELPSGEHVETKPIIWGGGSDDAFLLFEPQVSIPHTITVRGSDECTASASVHFMIDSVSIDVVGLK